MSSIFQNSPEVLVKEVDSFSGGSLHKKGDLQRLFEAAYRNNKEDKLPELVFTAKYIMGLKRVLAGGAGNPEASVNSEQIKHDFTNNLKKILEQFKDVLAESEEHERRYFEKEYLEMTQEGFANLNLLLADLEWTKKYLNAQKRQNSN